MQLKAEVFLHFKSQQKKSLEVFKHVVFCMFKKKILILSFSQILASACFKQKAWLFTGKPVVCLFKIQSELDWNLVPIPSENFLGHLRFSNCDHYLRAQAWFCMLNLGVVPVFKIETTSPV